MTYTITLCCDLPVSKCFSWVGQNPTLAQWERLVKPGFNWILRSNVMCYFIEYFVIVIECHCLLNTNVSWLSFLILTTQRFRRTLLELL